MSMKERSSSNELTNIRGGCYRKTTHPRNANEGQGWEATETADTLNVFDFSEMRTPILIVEVQMENEVFEIGNGQACNTELHEVSGSLDCMHDQKAILINGGVKQMDETKVIENHIMGSRFKVKDDDVFQTLTGRMGTGGNNQPMVKQRTIVRRLTPKECERLMAFPDEWTNIGTWVDSNGKKRKTTDRNRYQALGNSLALPYWEWQADRMVRVLKESGVEHPTMASLFDGIGGFPLVYQRCGCEPVWASEIEDFCIAVTKYHFPED